MHDYYRLAAEGALHPDDRVELLNGRIIPMSPIGSRHASMVKRLLRLFTRQAHDRWILAVQDPVRLADDSEPEPDLALLKPSPDVYASRHPQPEDVYLLIEVADSTLEYDREEKIPAYGRAGISEVWIVNLLDDVIAVYREPHYTGYARKIVLGPGGQASPQAFPELVVRVSELLQW